MIVNELKNLSANNFTSLIRGNLINPINFTNPINSISPTSQPSHYECNL